MMQKLKLLKTFKSGIIPDFSESYIVINGVKGIGIYNLDWKSLTLFDNEGYVRYLNDHILIVEREDEVGFESYSLPSGKKLAEYDLFKTGNFCDEKKYLIRNKKEKYFALQDIETKEILWEVPAPINKELSSVFKYGNKVIGKTPKQDALYCFDFETGTFEWHAKVSDLELSSQSRTMRVDSVIDNILIGINQDLCWFGLDLNTGKQLWASRQPNKHMSNDVMKDGINHVITFYDYENAKKLAFTYSRMDCRTGEILCEVDITEKLRALKLIYEDRYNKDQHYNLFGGSAVGETHLFFAYDHLILSLNLETFELEILYEQEKQNKFYNVHVFNNQLYVTDDCINLYVLEGGQL